MTDIEAPREIKLKSSDGFVFSVPRNIIGMSVILETLIQDSGLDDKDAPKSSEPEPLQLHNVNGRTLKKVLEWCHQHAAEPPVAPSELSAYDAEYVNLDQTTLFEIILVANNLEIEELLNTCCTAIADMMKGKTTEELREMFEIENDFTPEEELAVKLENELISILRK